ncbi:hypothetical protein LX36DRAFT_676218, partial [Colletotrichum falcatum]
SAASSTPAPTTAATSSPATTKSSSPASHPPREKPQPPPTAPTGPAAGNTTPTTTTNTTTTTAGTGAATPGANTALNAAARLGSGANPRTKLTETELAAKMEQMRILNAEKTRKFEQAEQDERSHAEAYARGMEEARQRRKLEEERRRRGEEERRRMDDERAKNRERKLKAMSMKEGGWDEGKDALAQEEDRQRVFRGANGGVRGSKSAGAGLAGSRFARDNDEGDAGDRHATEERRGGAGAGRGRGRGRGAQGRGGGRGGRGGGGGGFGNEHEQRDPAASSNGGAARVSKPAVAPAPVINTDEFPALPGAKSSAVAGDAPLPVLSPLGRWDDEMEAFDAAKKSGADATE